MMLASALSRLDLGITRSALAPVHTAQTGANALRLIFPTLILNLDTALVMIFARSPL